MLGVMTQLELQVTNAYRLKQQVDLWPWEEVLERWDELVEGHRHFGFFWLPSEESGALYNLDGHGHPMTDKCYVKIYDEAMPDEPDSAVEGRLVDRCYRIYPMVYDPNFHELEYFVPLERAPDAIQALRELMLRSLPQSVYPMEVRTVGPTTPTCHRTAGPRPRRFRSRVSPAPITGTTCVRSTRCSRNSTHASTGQAPLPHAGTAPRSVSRGGQVHRHPARVRPSGHLPRIRICASCSSSPGHMS